MVKSTEIGFFKKMYLKYLTAEQENAILNDDLDRYFELTAKHFKVYFKMDMVDTVLNKRNSPEAQAVLDRHGAMVTSSFYSKSSLQVKINTYRLAKQVFVRQLLLQQEL